MDKLTEQDKLIKKLQRDGADAQTHAETAQRELSALRIDDEQRAKRQDDEIARLSRELDTARDVELQLRRHVTDADQSEAALRKRLAAEEAAEGYRGEARRGAAGEGSGASGGWGTAAGDDRSPGGGCGCLPGAAGRGGGGKREAERVGGYREGSVHGEST